MFADADCSRQGRKGWIEKRKFHRDDAPLLGYGGAARMWESFFNKRGVRSGLGVMFGFAHATGAKGVKVGEKKKLKRTEPFLGIGGLI